MSFFVKITHFVRFATDLIAPLLGKGFLLLLLYCPSVVCQIPVGAWRDHLSWNTAEAVAIAGNKVYCSNGVGLCIYDMQSRSLDKLTKVNGLNDAGITALQYAVSGNIVIAGYANGNVDIISAGNIFNIPDIKRSGVYADKCIRHIYVQGTRAYLSCSFGIVLIDLQLRQIRDTYVIGDGGVPVTVYALTEFGGNFYAATAQGIKKADAGSTRLTDFSMWEKVYEVPTGNSVFTQIVSSTNRLYVCDINNNVFTYESAVWSDVPLPVATGDIHRLTVSDDRLLISTSGAVLIYNTVTNLLQERIATYYTDASVVAFDATIGEDGAYWIADNRQGLVRRSSTNTFSFHLLNGPSSNNTGAFRFKSDRLLAVTGGRDHVGKPLNRKGEIYTFYGNQWTSISPQGVYDFTDIDIASDRPNTYYVSSWGEGVYVFENGIQTAHYTQENSELTADFSGSVYCGGVLMDKDNKLWVSNDRHTSILAAGQWKSRAWQTNSAMGRFTEDSYQQIWTTLYNSGLCVFSKASSEQGQSGMIRFYPYNYTSTSPINQSNQIVNTPDGVIWVGTTQGPVYYKDPSSILQGEGTMGVHPGRTGSGEPDRFFALLGSENILSVAVDGAYRKWFGTETGGAFLIAENNAGEVKHFTVDNSPLFSNKIYDIAINDKTGEVFFATDYGIISYRSDAVSSGDDFGNVYVFPNPVRPEYQGEITITGLIKDAYVKITDTAGNLVYQTRTLGGQAVWNGRNQTGRRVSTGVYPVFCTNDDGSKTYITKLLFIH